jgi:hypothetical protein
MYFEMNGFDINPDEWHFHGFAYREAGDIWDPEWLAHWNYDTSERLVLPGMEAVQSAFSKHYRYRRGEVKSLQLEMAASITLHLVCAHFVSLIANAHQRAKRVYKPLRGLPVIATAHDWDQFGQST